MKKVIVVGAGFTGLTSAYYLCKAGFQVEIFEKSPKAGGLIQTVTTKSGLAETAANGFLATQKLESLAVDIGLKLIPANKESRRRFIYRSNPRRWPLFIFETIGFLYRFLFFRKEPRANETIREWGERVFGSPVTQFLLEPALKGIYAGSIDKLSSTLIFSRFFGKSRRKTGRGQLRGTVSCEKGMAEFIETLEKHLQDHGVKIHYSSSFVFDKSKFAEGEKLVIATGPHEASEIVATVDEDLAHGLSKVEMLPVVTATVFFPRETGVLEGFGCLFPKAAGFRALGVLFNRFIFPNRSTDQSETWIFGGATDPHIVTTDDTEILQTLNRERARFYRKEGDKIFGEVLDFRIQRWPRGIPHYTVALEKWLSEKNESFLELESRGIFLAGNYLGSLGLSQILERVATLPERVKK